MHTEERSEWLKVLGATLVALALPVVMWASWARSPGADANASAHVRSVVTWNTQRCDTARRMLRRGVSEEDLAIVLARSELTPLDVQCLTHPSIPTRVQVAALERIVETYPRFRPALVRKKAELKRRAK